MKDLNELNKYRLEDKERMLTGMNGDSSNGIFKVFVGGKSFYVIASDGGGWEHVSVTPYSNVRKTCPTWEEMSAIKDMFFKPDECVVEYHPPKSVYINIHPLCLHLWRPKYEDLPAPSKFFV